MHDFFLYKGLDLQVQVRVY